MATSDEIETLWLDSQMLNDLIEMLKGLECLFNWRGKWAFEITDPFFTADYADSPKEALITAIKHWKMTHNDST